MIRLFVGIALPAEQKLLLSGLHSGIPGAKWVDSGNLHVTLRFIGEVDEGTATDLDEALAGIKARRFELALAGVGQFGGGQKARALWVGVERNPALLQLHEKVEHAAMRIGLPPEERRYTPHVTLARLKYVQPGKVQEFIEEHSLFRAPPFPVARFSLIASYLTKSGPIYEDQADYELA
jgi:2'-5' RNA ligase